MKMAIGIQKTHLIESKFGEKKINKTNYDSLLDKVLLID